MSRAKLPYAAFSGCALIWGSTFLAIKIGNDSLAPIWSCFLRLLIASILLNAVMLANKERWPKGSALKAALIYGFWEFGVSLPLLYWGEKITPSGVAAVIYAVCPIAAIFEAKLMGMELLSPKRLGAAAVAMGGVAMIFWRDLDQRGSPLALSAILVAACAGPLAVLFLQQGPKQSAITANAVGAPVGAAVALVASIALREHRVIPTNVAEAFPVVYLAIASSTGAFVLFAWLANHWKTTSIAFLGVIVPMIAVSLGVIFRHETYPGSALIGAAFVIIGVALALRADSSPELDNS